MHASGTILQAMRSVAGGVATCFKEQYFSMQRVFEGSIAPSQSAGLLFLLDHWEKKQHGCVRCLAYALATATWETRTTMQPIEVGVEAGEDARFRGRGYLPCAGEDFYRRASTLCGIDLVAQPEALLEPPLAAEVLFAGLVAGTFTGVPLTDYLGPTRVDWVGARHAVGTMDAALKTANLVRVYWVALQGASIRPDGESTESVDLGPQTPAAADGVTASTRR